MLKNMINCAWVSSCCCLAMFRSRMLCSCSLLMTGGGPTLPAGLPWCGPARCSAATTAPVSASPLWTPLQSRNSPRSHSA